MPLCGRVPFVFGDSELSAFSNNLGAIGTYFANINEFVLPLNDYHAFYLFWWFAWSIMIGQFTARFVGGLRTYQVLAAMLIFPSIPIAIWFSVLYHYHEAGIPTEGIEKFCHGICWYYFCELTLLIRLSGYTQIT